MIFSGAKCNYVLTLRSRASEDVKVSRIHYSSVSSGEDRVRVTMQRNCVNLRTKIQDDRLLASDKRSNQAMQFEFLRVSQRPRAQLSVRVRQELGDASHRSSKPH